MASAAMLISRLRQNKVNILGAIYVAIGLVTYTLAIWLVTPFIVDHVGSTIAINYII